MRRTGGTSSWHLIAIGVLFALTTMFTVQHRPAQSQAPSLHLLDVGSAGWMGPATPGIGGVAIEEPSGDPAPDDPPDDPPAPPRVALQAGHWRAAEAPDELAGLRSNGTRGGGKHESEVTLEIATLAAEILEEMGFDVEILPTTIPPAYRADLFISIHADGHNSPSASGFSVAPPRRDATGVAGEFAELLALAYREATGLRHRQMTRRMQGYYAFNSRRYEHALHPMTVAVILETGFLTSPADRRVIVDEPERSARGIAEAVARHFAPRSHSSPPAVAR